MMDVGRGCHGVYAAGVFDYELLHKNPSNFIIVTTEVQTGQVHYFTKSYIDGEKSNHKMCFIYLLLYVIGPFSHPIPY